MVRNVGGWETTFSSRLEASDQSICLSPGKSFLASRAHQRISVSVPASIVQHLWPDTTLYAFFSIAIHVEFKSAAVVWLPGRQMPPPEFDPLRFTAGWIPLQIISPMAVLTTTFLESAPVDS